MVNIKGTHKIFNFCIESIPISMEMKGIDLLVATVEVPWELKSYRTVKCKLTPLLAWQLGPDTARFTKSASPSDAGTQKGFLLFPGNTDLHFCFSSPN